VRADSFDRALSKINGRFPPLHIKAETKIDGEPRRKCWPAIGGVDQQSVPRERRNSDIGTTSHNAGPLSPGERAGAGASS
jgi:hypothetical protein